MIEDVYARISLKGSGFTSPPKHKCRDCAGNFAVPLNDAIGTLHVPHT